MGGGDGIRRVVVALLAGIVMFVLTAAAEAAFPGHNGKIVFEKAGSFGAFARGLNTINPDGTGETTIVSNELSNEAPAWSPDGRRIVFTRRFCGSLTCGAREVWAVNADGSGAVNLTNTGGTEEREPTWLPDGSKIAFERVVDAAEDIFTMNPDGTGQTNLTITPASGELEPAWSPDGLKIAFVRDYNIYVMNSDGSGQTPLTNDEIVTPDDINHSPSWSPSGSRIAFAKGKDIYVMNADGSNPTKVITSPISDASPAWSPDGSRIAFSRQGSCDGPCFVYLYTVKPDGTGLTQLTFADDASMAPDWQPIPYTGYARPKGATPLRVPLVIAYRNCTAPNEQHGPPLAFPSCAPPVEQSDWVTTGTADSNGQATQFVGSMRFDTVPGNPATLADEANVKAVMDITDVRRKDNMSDYVGDVQATIIVRITDRFNAVPPGGGTDPATLIDIPFPFPGSCAATADPAVGSTCTAVTSIDAIVPAAIKEGQRSIWQMGQVEVSDGGSDGSSGTAPNTVFARQGIFVP